MSEVEVYQEEFDPKRKSGERQWRWRVRAANGEIVASGEGYSSRADAVRGFSNARNAMSSAVVKVEAES